MMTTTTKIALVYGVVFKKKPPCCCVIRGHFFGRGELSLSLCAKQGFVFLVRKIVVGHGQPTKLVTVNSSL